MYYKNDSFKVKRYKNIISKKMNLLCDNKSLVNGMLFSMFSFINKGFIFLLLLILANYINPKEYGYLSLFVTVLMVISYIIALSTEGYLSISYLKDKREGTRQTFTDIMLIAITILTLLIIVLFLGFRGNYLKLRV